MRRLFLCLFLMLIIAGYPCEGYSWTLPENISNNIGRSVRPAIVIDSKGFIHVFWNDNTTGNHEILYSFNNGQGFSEPLQLSSNSGPSTRPHAVIDSLDNIHVVWYDYSSGNAEILYVKGREYSWSQPINISQTPKGSLWPDIAIDSNNNLFVVWSDNSSGNYDILLKTSINRNLMLNISNNSGSSEKPAIATDILNQLHVVWYDNTDTITFSRILYTKWNGKYFAPIISLSPPIGGSWRPAIATDSLGQVHVVYGYDVYGNAEILYTKWDGSNWTTPINISKTTGTSSHPSIIVDRLNKVHVAWMDDTPSPKVFDIYYTRFDGYNWSSPVNLTNNSGDSQNPALAVGMDNSIHLVWYESVDGVGDIFYMKDANE